LGTLKISEASRHLESSDYKESGLDTEEVETGLVMNLQHSMMPGDIEISSSFIQKQGLSNIDLNAPVNKLGNKIEKIEDEEDATIQPSKDDSFDIGLNMNLGGNKLMGGDDDDEDDGANGLALPESML
jgi:hypothetical protein